MTRRRSPAAVHVHHTKDMTLAGVPYTHLGALTPWQLTIADGAVTVTSTTHRWVLHPEADAVVCGPCAVARWVEALDVLVTKVAMSAVADLIEQADPVTADSSHVCQVVPALMPRPCCHRWRRRSIKGAPPCSRIHL